MLPYLRDILLLSVAGSVVPLHVFAPAVPFGADLKKRYEPTGMDKKTEQLVRIWDSGAWEGFYYSIYFEYPKKTVIPREYLTSSVKSRQSRREAQEEEEKEASFMKRALESALED